MPTTSRRISLPFEWRQGEHLAITGETGSGKSTLAAVLLAARWPFYVVVKTKPDDVHYPGRKIGRASQLESATDRAILDLSESPKETQAARVAELTDSVWKQGGWTVYYDELFYLERLRLVDSVEQLLTQGRSKGLTVVVGMQRPARVTRFALSQATHVVSFGQEGRDAKILRDATSERMRAAVEALPRYHFAWYHRITREVWTGRVQDLAR
ncbi:MAG: ATP-binding cassette domain-containing protein [Elusimicrobia bacterium]|nr:ATP-binding cassette domain-containing protein [Elusimicrobiota bacterium]